MNASNAFLNEGRSTGVAGSGPARLPASHSRQRPPASEKPPGGCGVLEPLETRLLLSSKVLGDVPEYIWTDGCAPTAGMMVLGYWDAKGYPSYIPGTNDWATNQAAIKTAISSTLHQRDYVPTPDPGTNHNDNCLADFMGTSRDPMDYGWSPVWTPTGGGVGSGLEDYANWRGYPAVDTSNEYMGFPYVPSFTFSDLQSEINANRPMVFLVDTDGDGDTNHFVPVIGYRTSPREKYACYRTKDAQEGVQWHDFEPMADGQPWGINTAIYFHPSTGNPDLVGSNADVVPEALQWGDSFTYDYSVSNYGDVDASDFFVNFYLSRDSNISIDEYIYTNDTFLGQRHVSGLSASGTTSGSITLTLPGSPGSPPPSSRMKTPSGSA